MNPFHIELDFTEQKKTQSSADCVLPIDLILFIQEFFFSNFYRQDLLQDKWPKCFVKNLCPILIGEEIIYITAVSYT